MYSMYRYICGIYSIESTPRQYCCCFVFFFFLKLHARVRVEWNAGNGTVATLTVGFLILEPVVSLRLWTT